MTKNIFFIIVIIEMCGCTKEGGDDKYYTLNYTDQVVAVLLSDTIHISVTQYGTQSIIKDSIPFSIEDNNLLGDTIKLRMEVKFGSYSETPTPYKQVSTTDDSLLLWYTSGPMPYYSFAKNSTITEIANEPKVAYYSIQNMVIEKSSNKFVTFKSKRMTR